MQDHRVHREQVHEMGLRMEHLLNDFGDAHLFYGELDDIDQTNVDDVSGDDTGQDLRWVSAADTVRYQLTLSSVLQLQWI